MNWKIPAIIIGILLVLSGGLWLYASLKHQASQQPGPGNGSVTGEGGGIAAGDTVPSPNVTTETRKRIESLLSVSKPTQSPGIYQVDQYPETDAPSVVPDYETTYFKDNDTFIIILYRQPLLETRQKAQESLLGKLGITREEACALNIEVRVNADINRSLAGQDLGLSFCPGSVDLLGAEEK